MHETSSARSEVSLRQMLIQRWRVILLLFFAMSGTTIAIESLYKLRAAGHPIWGLVLNHVSVAAVVALGLYFLHRKE